MNNRSEVNCNARCYRKKVDSIIDSTRNRNNVSFFCLHNKKKVMCSIQKSVTKNEYACQIKERKKYATYIRVMHLSTFSGKISINKKKNMFVKSIDILSGNFLLLYS
jgi:hypothetical protein